MKKVKVLMIDQIYNELMTNASIAEIKYSDEMRIKDIISLCNRNKNFKDFEFYDKYLDYPFEKYLRAKISLENGKIDWNMDMNDLLVSKALKILENDFLVIRSHGGIGGPGEDFITSYLFGKLIDYFLKFISKLFISYKDAVNIIQEHTKNDIEYINDIIKVNDIWPCGFISCRDFKKKYQVEKRIMKKLNYKLVSGNWIRK